MKEKAHNFFKKTFSIALSMGALAGGILAVIQLSDFLQKEKIAEYNDPYIPLVYKEVDDFRKFLNDNSGKKVKFNTQISFDNALAVNFIAHKVCNYSSFLEAVRSDSSNVEKTDLGIMKFKHGFKDPQDSFFYDSEKGSYDFGVNSIDHVSCYDKIRIKMKDPSRLRLSHGGTGIVSLPFEGTFVVEARYFSGPSIEYTLREL